MDQNIDQEPAASESLETQGTVISPDGGSGPGNAFTPITEREYAGPPKRNHSLRGLVHGGNVYLLAFLFIVLLAGIIVGVMYLNNSRQSSKPQATIKTQDLSADALKQLADSGGLKVGDSGQVLNIQSNAVFAGTALVRGDLQVAGTIRTGGNLSLTGLNVAGPGSFEKLQARSLAIAESASIGGQLSTSGTFNAAGGGTFGGAVSTPTLNANTLQLAGDLVLNNHFQAGGARPGFSGGNALGGGGTTNLSGSDTAGSITINTGSGPSAGCFINVRFARSFNSPRVNVTPVGAAAGSLNWYVDRSGSGFSVCTSSPAPGGQSFGFDYFVAG